MESKPTTIECEICGIDTTEKVRRSEMWVCKPCSDSYDTTVQNPITRSVKWEPNETDLIIQKCDELLRLNTPEKHRELFYKLFKRVRKVERDLQELTASHQAELKAKDEEIGRLKQYTRHFNGCGLYTFSGITCTCGLDQLLTTKPKEEKG